MCLCCCVKEKKFGEVLPGIYLMQATKDYYEEMLTGQYGLVICNDPFIIFKPLVADPYTGMTDEEIEADTTITQEQFDAYINSLSEFREFLYLTPHDGYTLYSAGIAAGYKPEVDCEFGAWLFDRVVKHIKNHE